MILRCLPAAAVALALVSGPVSAAGFAETFPGLADLKEGPERTFLESLDYRHGEIDLRGGFARIAVPEGYYFLGPEDANRVLTEAWANPPADEMPLGMIFPAGLTPYHAEAWAVEVSWDPVGYVSDEDADTIDYGELLATMQEDTRAESEWRQQNGYDRIELIGWAAPPRYDREGRKLHWAKELSFAGSADHTLNYNLRILGRKGVLVMNFIADMDQIGKVEAALPDVLAMARFNEGARYEDFDASIDEVAAIGIGGLIAGKVLSKAGILAIAIAFLKKGWIFIVLGLVALWRFLRRRPAA